MEEKIFCNRCGQRLIRNNILSNILKKPAMKIFEFKDGYYCEECSKKKVEEARK